MLRRRLKGFRVSPLLLASSWRPLTRTQQLLAPQQVLWAILFKTQLNYYFVVLIESHEVLFINVLLDYVLMQNLYSCILYSRKNTV